MDVYIIGNFKVTILVYKINNPGKQFHQWLVQSADGLMQYMA